MAGPSLFRLRLAVTVVACFLVSGFWLPSSGHAQDITTGLIHHWKFDDGSGSNAADSAGSVTGTLSGPTWTTGYNGGALQWSGGSENVDLGTMDLSGSAVTISAWVRDDGCDLSTTDCRVISKAVSSAESDHWWMISLTDNTNRYFRFRLKTGGSTTTLIANSGGTTIGNWYLVTVTYDGSNMRIYSNGVQVGSVSKTGALDTNNAVSAFIGQNPGLNNQDWVGLIDDVRIYSRALTLTDITALYTGYANCSSPPGATGDIVYSADWRTPQYCNGSRWIDMGKKKYTPRAVTFDGTNDYLTRGADLTGNADGKTATGSFWFRRNGGLGSSQHVFANTAGRFRVSFNGVDRFQIEGLNTSNTAVLTLTTTNSFTDSNWHHAMFSFDLTDTAKRFIYIDGVAEALTAANYTDDNIDFTRVEHAIGAATAGANKLNADIADLWLNSGTYLDLSVAANRNLFYQNGPVWLGSTGSLPTGTAPEVFLSGNTSTWHTNDGTGGGFTVNGGGLTPAAGPNAATGGGTGVTSGLIGHWKFDESSGTSAADSSGNANAGTLTNGPVWRPTGGKIGGGLRLDGTDDYVNVGNQTELDDPAALSMSAWIYPAVSNFDGVIAGKSYGATLTVDSGYSFGAGTYDYLDIGFFVGYSSGTLYRRSSTKLNVNEWNLATMTWDGSNDYNNIHLYINGVETAYANGGNGGGSPVATAAYPFAIGANPYASTIYMETGYIDDVRVYDRVLSAAEVAELYTEGGGSCTGPVATPGSILYNGASHVPQYCDGADWVAMGKVPGAGGGGCSSPTGAEGDLMYNADEKVVQYCDGADWIQVGKKWVAPTSGLIGHWKFDETSGTSAADSAGSNTGTLTSGPTWTTGKDGGAVSFDGTDDLVIVTDPNIIEGIGSMSVSVWVRSGIQNLQGARTIVGQHGAGADPFEISLDGNETVRFEVDTGVNTVVNTGTNNIINDANWHHIVGIYDGTNIYMYIDGVRDINQVALTGSIVTATNNLQMGGILNDWQGAMDDVRVYNRALAADEVQSLYYATGGQ